MPPVVLVTTTTDVVHGVPRVRVNAAYVHALERAGCVPLLLPPLTSVHHVEGTLAGAHGVLLTGGEDVEPARYGAEPHPETEPPNRARDATELALTAAARARGLPLLAVCRGLQLLNVACGGTLVQDLRTQCPAALAHAGHARGARVHEIVVETPSRLAEALDVTRLRVNSRHHQAVARLGGGLRAVAHSPDGVVEAAEADGTDWWALGVQWHPEDLIATDEPWERRLFAAFARRCAGAT